MTARVLAKGNAANGELARSVAEALQGLKLEELHTEEGRLDEVFRKITWSETTKEEAK